ncbi:DUF2303 family protein [Paracoccus saliphilus]|uniref:DUF2303 family protein n=1 Tax=Paracoccus saliphilus TaxID=405559 RepID=A0AA46A6H0_9RHOB|nr:DUF2303 family protein [Paracoccus saliphilus]WCR01659.1 DUF2303 family protein [Paracoccus saliphilus]SIS98201.1 Uncharacterized conserved protein YfdQ, DUF2303 family [Paracoccus saliphilus]
MTQDTPKNIAETVIEEMKRVGEVQFVSLPTAEAPETPYIVAAPEGMKLHDLTAQHRSVMEALRPLQRKGKAQLADLDSLIAWTNRFKGEATALFGQIHPTPKMLSVIDYHGGGAPVIDPEGGDPSASHGRHTGVYTFPVSEEWKRWNGISGKSLTKDEFGEFIEDNANDFLDPTPALLGKASGDLQPWEERMIEIAQKLQGRFGQYAALAHLSREFQVHETGHLQVKTDRDTGEAKVQFLTEHKDPDGQPLSLPNLFMIAIPVFEEGALYRLAVRFRYRKSGSEVRFIVSLYNADVALRDAAREAMYRAQAETEVPLMMGVPEVGVA